MTHEEKVDVAYNFANAEPHLKKFFEELEHNPEIRNMQTGTTQKYKELAEKIISNLPVFIEDQVKIFLMGNPGCGKTQFVNSMVLEAADKHGICSYYLSASDFYNAVFDFNDKSKLQTIYDKVNRPVTKILILDDLGSEIASNGDKRIDELAKQYNDLIRAFNRKNGLIMVTSNNNMDDLRKTYKNDPRLFDMIFQEGSTRYYQITSKAKFRQSRVAKSLELLD